MTSGLLALTLSAQALAVAPQSVYLINSFDLTPSHYNQLPSSSYQQSTAYTCAPAAAMELLHYYGKLSTGEMNKDTELRVANEMGTTSDGTNPDQLIGWLQKQGFRVELGHRISYDVLMQNINRGIPTLVAIEHHWTLATGYYDDGNNHNYIIFTDSVVNRFVMSREQIDSLWLGDLCRPGTCESDLGDYIIAIPTH